MKAAYIEAPGPAQSIIYGDLPEPDLPEHHLLVQVIASTVDPVDTYIRSGSYHVEMPLPFIVGRDMVGKVVGLGASVVNFKLGELVWCNNQGYGGRQGTCAELLSIHEDFLYALPEGSNPLDTVGVFHSALTAVTGLFWKAQIKPGETIFINGGSGNVGTAVMQLAQATGARVAVSAGSDEKRDWCLDCGADLVINYHKDNVTDALKTFAPEGLNIYWDASGKLDLESALPVMAAHGRILVMSGLDRACTLPVGQLYTKNLTLFGFTITGLGIAELAAGASIINENLALGKLKAKIHSKMRFSETAKAHSLVESGNVFGKIILTP